MRRKRHAKQLREIILRKPVHKHSHKTQSRSNTLRQPIHKLQRNHHKGHTARIDDQKRHIQIHQERNGSATSTQTPHAHHRVHPRTVRKKNRKIKSETHSLHSQNTTTHHRPRKNTHSTNHEVQLLQTTTTRRGRNTEIHQTQPQTRMQTLNATHRNLRSNRTIHRTEHRQRSTRQNKRSNQIQNNRTQTSLGSSRVVSRQMGTQNSRNIILPDPIHQNRTRPTGNSKGHKCTHRSNRTAHLLRCIQDTHTSIRMDRHSNTKKGRERQKYHTHIPQHHPPIKLKNQNLLRNTHHTTQKYHDGSPQNSKRTTRNTMPPPNNPRRNHHAHPHNGNPSTKHASHHANNHPTNHGHYYYYYHHHHRKTRQHTITILCHHIISYYIILYNTIQTFLYSPHKRNRW